MSPTETIPSTEKIISPRLSAAEAICALLESFDEELVFPYEQLRVFSATDLLAYLRLSHRYFLERKLPEIEQTIYNLFRDYADSDELLLAMCRFFVNYQRKLVRHIQAEERELFPYIEALLAVFENGSQRSECVNNYSAAHFLTQHTDVEEDLRNVSGIIESCLHQRQMPLPFRVFVHQIQRFEIELCKHAIVEDEFLLPYVLEMEKELRSVSMESIP